MAIHRVLFVVEHLYPMGPARTLFPVATYLKNQGYDIVVAVLGQRAFEPERWTAAGLRVFFVNGDDRTPLHTGRDAISVFRELRSLIRLVEPDIVHAWSGESIWLSLLATQPVLGLPPLPEFRLLATRETIGPGQGWIKSRLYDRMCRRLEGVVVPHEVLAQRMVTSGVARTKIEVVAPSAVVGPFLSSSVEAFTDRDSESRQLTREQVRAELQLPADAILAVTASSLVPRHRLKDLIWATDLLACVRDDFHFAIVGIGPQLRRLKRFAAQTEARPNVHFLGLPNQPERFLAAADVYWHSHLQAPVSANLLSAMAMGIPSISVLGPGTTELIRHQETGFAVNFGARDEFARWTKFLIEQTGPAKKLARQGQVHVQRHFSSTGNGSGYQQMYDRGQ